MGLPKIEHLPHYTYEDYKIWEGKWELINGIPYAMSPSPGFEHQVINGKIYSSVINGLQNCSKCQAVFAFDWKINEDTVVQPDLSIICYPFERGPFLTHAPTVIFEILSPSTAKKDRTIKYDLFESNGVKYFILVHPQKKTVEIFQLINEKYEKVKETSEEVFTFDLQVEADCSFDLNFKEIW